MDDDAVVGPDRVGLQVVLVADPGRERQAPGSVHTPAPGREHAQAPVADLVPEALHDHGLVGGHHAGGSLLLAQIRDQVLGRAAVQVVLGRQLLRVGAHGLAGEGADRLAQLRRPADAVALPERHRARDARGGGDDHPVAGDLLDPPGGGAEQEGLARAGLVDHLLVELANPAAVRQVHAIEAAVGNRARIGDRELLGPGPAAQGPGARSHTSRGRSSAKRSDG